MVCNIDENRRIIIVCFFFLFSLGSCCSSSFANNISNYLGHMLDLVSQMTQSGSLTDEVRKGKANRKLLMTRFS